MDDLWVAVRFLHLLAMAFFVGGQLLLAAAVVPVERKAPDRARLRAIARRFGAGTLVAIAVLLATGSALAGHFGQGKRHAALEADAGRAGGGPDPLTPPPSGAASA